MIALVGQALFWLLCAMTAPRETTPAPPARLPVVPPEQPAPEPTLDIDPLDEGVCPCGRPLGEAPLLGWWCSNDCRRAWWGARTVPLIDQPTVLPDGTTLRRYP